MSTLTFEEMNLSPETMNGLRDVNYEEPSDIQQSVVPQALEGTNILAKDDGSKGKFGSFIIPALEILNKSDKKEGTRILVLTPHHGDAQEIDELVWAMGYHSEVQCATVGLKGDWDEQKKSLDDGVSVIVANPGRLLELLEKNRFVFRELDLLVLDKVNELASLGLTGKIEEIKKRIISDYQTLAYSEEFNEEVKKLVDMVMTEPTVLGFENVQSNGQLIGAPPEITGRLKQGYIKVPDRMKITTLTAHLKSTSPDNCVIFCASKRGTDRLYRVLRKNNYTATSLHGKLSDEKRSQRFANFTGGDVQLLLVADISAADLDLANVQQVINYDVPNDPDEYRYRAGLVGQGKAGRIVSLVSKQDRSDIKQLKNELGEAPEELPLPDEVKQKLKQRRNKQKGGGGGKGRGRDRGKGKRDQKKKREKELELPRPSYDKLSGGRSGNKEDDGVVGFFKKLFSSGTEEKEE